MKHKPNKTKEVKTTIDLLQPARICRADVLLSSCIIELKKVRLPYPQLSLAITRAIAEAINKLPAYNIAASWSHQDTRSKSYKFICSNCVEVSYCLPDKDGNCTYNFCPRCGAIMNESAAPQWLHIANKGG